jgi:UDP-N-acetylmuramoyl-tripeptide--D-alanyl-D-alanine ligase
MFFAIKGSRVDGHHFVREALEKGAFCAVGEQPLPYPRYVQVENTINALQQLASYHRERMAPKSVIAIVGSNGKTTTKNITATLFEEIGKTHATPGNWNNHLGLPLTLLKAPKDVEYLVLELGDNQPGDLRLLVSLCKPTLVAVTNISHDHIGVYGSPEANFEGKMEAVRYAMDHGFPLVLPSYQANQLFPEMADYHTELRERVDNYPSAYYVGEEEGDLLLLDIETRAEKLKIRIQENRFWKKTFQVNLPLWGIHNCYNLGTALAILSHFAPYNEEKIVHSLNRIKSAPNRGEIVCMGPITWILDAYNANPLSMRYAIDFFLKSTPGRKGLVLGAMNELGVYHRLEHERLAEWLSSHEKISEVAYILLMGADMRYFQERWSSSFVPVQLFSSHLDIVRQIRKGEKPISLLLKGSRTCELEKVIQIYKEG